MKGLNKHKNKKYPPVASMTKERTHYPHLVAHTNFFEKVKGGKSKMKESVENREKYI